MLDEIITHSVLWSLFSILCFIGLVFLICAGIKREEVLYKLGPILSMLCLSLGLGALISSQYVRYLGDSPRILVRKAGPGVFFDQYGKLAIGKIPEDVPKIYESGNSEHSGYTVRKRRWVYRIGINALPNEFHLDARECETIIATGDNEVVLGNGQIVPLSENVKYFTQNISADSWWRKENPGKVQGEVEFLVWPKGKIWDARIIKYVLRS